MLNPSSSIIKAPENLIMQCDSSNNRVLQEEKRAGIITYQGTVAKSRLCMAKPNNY